MFRLLFGAVFVVIGSLLMAAAWKDGNQGAMAIAAFLLLTGFMLPRKRSGEVAHVVPVVLVRPVAVVKPRKSMLGTIVTLAVIATIVIAILHGGGK